MTSDHLPSISDDHVTSMEGFQVHAEIVFTLREPVSRTPAGIEDFANVVRRTFTQRLAAVLAPPTDPGSTVD